MDGNVYEILPQHGLDQSILAAVFIGILIQAIFTEAYGWVFVGLVVPGYLASLITVLPEAALAVTLEAMMTYLLARWLSDWAAKSDAWGRMFGRDRFFLIVLVSIAVRQVSELWLLVELSPFIESTFDVSLTGDSFSSIGLVLVPLLANMFWKVGLVRGMTQASVPILGTYLLLVFVLLPHTNLSFNALELTYEDVALDFLGSPKAYILLLTGALVATRVNLVYGWDFNGILVPSLLALTWLEPALTINTVCEAIVLYYAARLFIALPLVRTLNLEGPRKVVVVFIIGFAVKYASGWLLGVVAPTVRVTDFFGFGYVLTTLLAVKMLQKGVMFRILLPATLVSLVAFIIGTCVGLALEFVAPIETSAPRVSRTIERTSQTLPRTFVGAVVLGEVRARVSPPRHLRNGRSAESRRRYTRLYRAVDHFINRPNSRVRPVHRAISSLPLRMHPVGDSGGREAFVLTDVSEDLRRQTGWETFVFRRGAPGPILEVVRPISEARMAPYAALTCLRLDCRGVLIAGADGPDEVANSAKHPRASINVARSQLTAPIVQLRVDESLEDERAVLHLRRVLPDNLDVRGLWPWPVTMSWNSPPQASYQWWRQLPETLVLRVGSPSLERAVATWSSVPLRQVSGDVTELVASFLQKDTAKYIEPSESELRALELVAGEFLTVEPDDLPRINALARVVGMEIVQVGDEVVALMPVEQGRRWSLLVRRFSGLPHVLTVPLPRREVGTTRVALALWRASAAQTLLIDYGLTHADGGKRLSPVASGVSITPFQAMFQAAHASVSSTPDALVLLVRGLSADDASADVLVGIGAPKVAERQVPEILARELATGAVAAMAPAVLFADGQLAHRHYIGATIPAIAYARGVGGAATAVLWFSPEVRGESEARPRSAKAHHRMFASLGIVSEELELAQGLGNGARLDAMNMPAVVSLLSRIDDYTVSGNPNFLRGVPGTTAAWSPRARASYLLWRGAISGRKVRVALPLLRGRLCAIDVPVDEVFLQRCKAVAAWEGP